MGTSDAYGGSGKDAWRKARQAVQNALGGPGQPGDPPDPQPAPFTPTDLGDLLAYVGDGLQSDDSNLRPGSSALGGVGPSLAAGTQLPKVPFIGRRPAGGDGSGRPSRSVITGARRTGTALGTGFALRGADAAVLSEIGLDLAELSALSPIEQTQRIVDRVFGASADENEHAGREAAAIILLGFLQADESAPDYGKILRDGVAEFIFHRAVVEISDQLTAGALNHAQAMEMQRQIRDYIHDLVDRTPSMTPDDGPPTPATCSRVAEQITVAAIDIIRKGG